MYKTKQIINANYDELKSVLIKNNFIPIPHMHGRVILKLVDGEIKFGDVYIEHKLEVIQEESEISNV